MCIRDRLHTLYNAGIQVCAGAVGNPMAKSVLSDLRNALLQDIYLLSLIHIQMCIRDSINTTPSKTSFDASDVSVLGKVNLMNLIAGYKGEPRLFEVEAVAGMGWLHYYVNGDGCLLYTSCWE